MKDCTNGTEQRGSCATSAGIIIRRWPILLVLLAIVLPTCQGCATVKPYEMEFLTDPIMLFDEINPDVASLEFLVFGDAERTWVTGAGGGGGGCVSCAGR
ncbi:hypothetical protein J7M28_02270 [bacterium]|nr:hypothetical protein [bacterium]